MYNYMRQLYALALQDFFFYLLCLNKLLREFL